MFIVIEGVDHSGKSTTCDKLHTKLKQKGLNGLLLKFPMYNSDTGRIIQNYLNGDYGKFIEPWIITSLFSLDKFNFKPLLEMYIKSNDYVLVDRYVLSNIVYSLARMKDIDSVYITQQLLKFEFEILSMPIPYITYIMDIDSERFKKVQAKLDNADIFEEDHDMIYRAVDMYNFAEQYQERLNIGKIIKIPYIDPDERIDLIIENLSPCFSKLNDSNSQ